MSISDGLEILFTRCWWEWPSQPSAFDYAYRGMNFVEGVIWCVLAALVVRRYRAHRNSMVELLYAAAFALFGLTDFVEMRMLCSWLIWLKALVLVVLLSSRYVVICRFYPTSKTY